MLCVNRVWAQDLPSLILIGDSTVRNGKGDGANGQWGWGEPLAQYLDPTRIKLMNRALGGRSSRTYYTGGQWEQVLAALKSGDVLMMQFGHNDGSAPDEPTRARGSLPGIGDETREIDNPITKKHEVVHTFGWYMDQFVTGTKAKGATPVVCSPIPRKIWKDGKVVRSKDTYAGWAAEVASRQEVPFLDLNELIAKRYEELGPERVESLFADEHTHTTLAGAELNAAWVIAGLAQLRPNPLAAYLAESALAISTAKA